MTKFYERCIFRFVNVLKVIVKPLLVAAVTRALGIVVKLNVEVNMFKKIILYLFRIIIILSTAILPSSERSVEPPSKITEIQTSNTGINHSGTQIVIMNCANCAISK